MSGLKLNQELHQSAVVANNAMNRERNAFGVNSYERDILLNPANFIENRSGNQLVSWMDVCCGTGKALIQTAQYFEDNHQFDIEFEGIDLVNFFTAVPPNFSNLKLISMPIENWNPVKKYDLITIVHGLHYIGNKLGVIKKCIENLKEDGLFLAHLDLNNVVLKGAKHSSKMLKNWFDENNLEYNSHNRILKKIGFQKLDFPFQYLGADDSVGANFTGQPAVDSYYTR